MRASRLIVATFLIPIAALFAYYLALLWDGQSTAIDSNGSALGVLVILASAFGVSRIAQDEGWAPRAAMSVALASAYFMLTWSVYGDSVISPDASPHLVWFGLCVAAFMPTAVILPASAWAWDAYRRRLSAAAELN